jgi:hypothetical protein
MASLEEIGGDTLVWQEGMADWVPLCEVPEFSRLFHQDVPPQTGEPDSSVPSDAATSMDDASAAEPSDVVTLKDFENHSVQFSRSRKTLLVVTNDYHAGPLELTKLDLLSFLTAMERSTLSSSEES